MPVDDDKDAAAGNAKLAGCMWVCGCVYRRVFVKLNSAGMAVFFLKKMSAVTMCRNSILGKYLHMID